MLKILSTCKDAQYSTKFLNPFFRSALKTLAEKVGPRTETSFDLPFKRQQAILSSIMSSLLSNIVLVTYFKHFLRLFIVFREMARLGIGPNNDGRHVFIETKEAIKKDMENQVASLKKSKDFQHWSGIRDVYLKSHPWLQPSIGSRLSWQGKYP